ncbi:MAG: ATP-dependent helicase [Candidatus Phytoplasma sp.]|nr:ATP-dependent helicase [Phytoplasma sp.]
MRLNEQQIKAIQSEEKNIFLLAGAGTGKTTVIIKRVQYLIEKNIQPDQILVLSFTEESAKELTKRINNQNIQSQTFHSYCLSCLPKKEISTNPPGYTQKEKLDISKYKNSLFKGKKPYRFNQYQQHLKKENKIDFDDILWLFLKQKTTKTYTYIFIDEFQDTNLLQYEVLKKMTNSKTSVFAVGDPDQSIYAFRGSEITIINRFIKEYKAEIFKLTLNYRSTPKIIHIANNLIKNNKQRIEKQLIPTKKTTGDLQIIITKNDDSKIIEIIKKNQHTTILYRNYLDVIHLKKRLKETYYTNYQLLTIHGSKGLEFDTVVVIGINQMLKTESKKSLEEERRLLFVAITRAKKNLYLISSHHNLFIQEIRDTKIRLKTIK